MGKFVHHEPISGGMFNLDASCATPSTQAWDDQLLCTLPVLSLVLDRMGADYAALHPKMRKPFLTKDIAPWIRLNAFTCSFFLSCPTSHFPLLHHFSGDAAAVLLCFPAPGKELPYCCSSCFCRCGDGGNQESVRQLTIILRVCNIICDL